jgi:hypothetical protein
MSKNIKKISALLGLSAIVAGIVAAVVLVNSNSESKKIVSPVSIQEDYAPLFEGHTVRKANSYGTEGTDYTADLVYRVNDTSLTACVSKVASSDTSIVIPYYYSDGTKTYTVTAIDYSGFANSMNLTSVTFQKVGTVSGASNITLMDAQCFASCPNLSSFNSTTAGRFVIPSNITEIHSASFMNCQSMLSLVVDRTANNLAAIDDNAFNGCISWNTSLSLNKHTAGFTIGEAAFANCIKLPQAMLRTGVTSIGASAFYNDYSLKLIGIPSTCTSIGEEAFRRCTAATAYIGASYRYQTGWPNAGSHATDANDSNTDYTSTQSASGTCVEGDWNYANSAHAIKIIVDKDDISISPDSNYIYSTSSSSITVNSVTKTLFRITIIQYIGSNQATLSVPDSWDVDAGDSTSWLNDSDGNAVGVVTEIASNAFSDSAIASLTLPCTLETINSYAFSGCTGISSLTLSETKTGDAFTSYFTSYIDGTSTNIPIGTYAAAADAGTDNNFGLTGLVTISDYAFSNSCTALTSLVIPHTVQTIGNGAFANYSGSVYDTGLPNLLTLSFNMYSDHTSCLKQIAPYAFYKMGNAITEANYGICNLVLPSSMVGNSTNKYIIGGYAFYNALNLGTVTMGELGKSSTTTAGYTNNIIQNYAFDYCTNLKWAFLGNGVYQLAGSVFADCTSMDWLYLPGTVGSSASRADSSVISNDTHCVVYCGASGTNLANKFNIGTQTIFNGSDDKDHKLSASFTYAPVYYGICGMKGITNVTTWGAYYIYTYDGSLDTTNAGVQMYYTASSSQWTLTKGLSYAGTVASDTSSLGNIVTVGAKSFFNVTNITSLIVSNTVTSIQEFAFTNASGLTSFGYTGATTTCPTTLTSIAQYAFSFSGLTSLTLDAAIVTLGGTSAATASSVGFGNCFFGCEALEDLNINTTTGKATGSSYYCDNDSTIGALYTFTTSGNTTTYNLVLITGSASGHNSGSTANGTYTIKDGTTIIGSWTVVTCRLTSLIIPSSVTKISDYAFHMFSADPGGSKTGKASTSQIMAATLTSITFVDKATSNCTYIGTGAFAYQTALTNIEMPDKSGNLIVLGQYTFRCCAALTSFTFPTNAYINDATTITNGYYKLSGYQFDRCYNLATVTIPSSINYLGPVVFWGCDLLATVNWTDIKYISNEAFSGCPSLTTIPAFSADLTYIGTEAFLNDNKLTSVDFSACTNLATIGNNAFKGCSTLTSLDLSNCTALTGASSIGTSAFSGCSSLTSAIYAPNVTAVNDSVFSGCSSLVTFTGSSNLTSINASAFSKDGKMTTVTGIANVTSIGDSAFYQCYVLATMTSVSKVQTIGASAFYQCYAFTSLTDFTSLVSIGNYGFQQCNKLVTFYLPSTLTTIGTYCFAGCTKLKETTAGTSKFIIPNSVTSIDTYAFNNDPALTYVQYSSGMTSIPDYCFNTDTTLATFIFNSTQITSIGTKAFNGDKALANSTGSGTVFTIPNSVSTIGTYCFAGCTSLVNVNLGSTASGSVLSGIPDYCFQGDNKLVQVVFNTGSSYMTSIGQNAFSGCSVLTNTGTSKLSSGANCFALPDSVASIGKYAFQSCAALINLYIGSGITSLGQYIISGNSSLKIYINLSYAQVTTYMNSSAFNTVWYNSMSYYCSSNSGNKPTGCKGYYSTSGGLITGVTTA